MFGRPAAPLLVAIGLLVACSGNPSYRTPWNVPKKAPPVCVRGQAEGTDAAIACTPAPARDAEAHDASLMADAATVNADGAAEDGRYMTAEQLRDPETCKGCHPSHYREWSGSMHAYAALDPVFIAMNRRGQRETNGALGDFCVRCHAPMAVADGLTSDGLNLDSLPDQKRGVSCYFCHNVVSVDADHNGELTVAGDNIMRGSIKDPADSHAHRSAYTDVFNHVKPERNEMCGGCHDIVTQTGVHMERTFKEYKSGLFSHRPEPTAPTLESCAGCHMPIRRGVAAVTPAGLQQRVLHEHLWPGVDVALTDFPYKSAMRSSIEDCQLGIASVAFFTLEVTPPNVFTFRLETNAGHSQPSGAAQDRRMWLEISSFDEEGNLIEASSSGIIGDGEIEDKPSDDPRYDPRLWLFRDRIFRADGQPTHLFWEAAPSQAHPSGYESNLLEVRKDELGYGTHFVEKAYELWGTNGGELPARVTARLRIRPIGMDVLSELVSSGDLDPSVVSEVPTFTFRAQIEWNRVDGYSTIAATANSDCQTYRCLLDSEAPGCMF